VAILVFLLMRIIPGDIVEMRFAEGQFFNKDLVAKERARLGLDQPVWGQLLAWLWGIIRLALMATAVAVLLAIPLGTLTALKQDT
jgi:peptide/nickel transport system permease protein